ncbi:MAG: hypothetical protein LWW86_13550 [Micrococcales bacterium]|nr:hypothetical protein [Micrococcales bacterium]
MAGSDLTQAHPDAGTEANLLPERYAAWAPRVLAAALAAGLGLLAAAPVLTGLSYGRIHTVAEGWGVPVATAGPVGVFLGWLLASGRARWSPRGAGRLTGWAAAFLGGLVALAVARREPPVLVIGLILAAGLVVGIGLVPVGLGRAALAGFAAGSLVGMVASAWLASVTTPAAGIAITALTGGALALLAGAYTSDTPRA